MHTVIINIHETHVLWVPTGEDARGRKTQLHSGIFNSQGSVPKFLEPQLQTWVFGFKAENNFSISWYNKDI